MYFGKAYILQALVMAALKTDRITKLGNANQNMHHKMLCKNEGNNYCIIYISHMKIASRESNLWSTAVLLQTVQP